MVQKSRKKLLLERKKEIILSRDNLIAFTKYMMPDPNDPDDATKSVYDPQAHHELIAKHLKDLEARKIRRLIINMPPRHGKTELASKKFLPWYVGRNPTHSVILGTYNEIFAQDFGRSVRDTFHSMPYRHVFPDLMLKKHSQASDRIETSQGGILAFVGRGGSATGRGGHLILLDDPIKDRKEADSKAIREQCWTWFTQVISPRLMDQDGVMCLVQCMTGDTPVLMADNTEKPLRDIRPGDRVKSYDNGRIVDETVLNWKSQGEDKVFAIKMKSGRTVRANARHPFLVVNTDGTEQWQKTATLTAGMMLRGVNIEENSAKSRVVTNQLGAKVSAIRTTTRTDGRGVFARLRQTRKVFARLTSNIVTGLLMPKLRQNEWSRMAYVQYATASQNGRNPSIGRTGSASIIATIRESLGDWSATPVTGSSANMAIPKNSDAQPPIWNGIVDEIESVTPCGAEEVFDIQVSRTENFIANRLCSHNTRWHEDDLVGRLTNPMNPYYNEVEASHWTVLDLPALAFENDPLGRNEGEALWPSRFGIGYLAQLRNRDSRGFSALYQGRPAPEEGLFFREHEIKTYGSIQQLPSNLRYYAASDHALSLEQSGDKTCLLPVGVDEEDNIWVLPDVSWMRMPTNTAIDAMLYIIKKRRPLFWWAEKSHITKSIGPFLRKRMHEEQIYCAIDEVLPHHDKQTRAQAIKGRMAQGKVYFPAFADWWSEAKHQLLTFPVGMHDDFVDALAYIGLGLQKQVSASVTNLNRNKRAQPKTGTLAWVKAQSKLEERERVIREQTAGW